MKAIVKATGEIISEEELRYYMIMGDMCTRIDMESKSISHLRFKTNQEEKELL